MERERDFLRERRTERGERLNVGGREREKDTNRGENEETWWIAGSRDGTRTEGGEKKNERESEETQQRTNTPEVKSW